MKRNTVINIVSKMLSFKILFSITHFEEVVVFSASEWIVSIQTNSWIFLQWFLNIPEEVLRNTVENLLF